MIRPYASSDATATYAVFFKAVREGAKARYTAAQRQAWAQSNEMPETWDNKLSSGTTFVAEDAGEITGFMSLLQNGHLDMAYVAPDQMGSGTALDLYDAIEFRARSQGLSKLTTEASHLAKPFFAKQDWTLETAQTVVRNGIDIPNFRMFKML
ncbi:GNAT family N-acetyltransferase [Litoreibacter sp.]|nr:GNAT family N-acetyltransferase [Litoreibacter sp.]